MKLDGKTTLKEICKELNDRDVTNSGKRDEATLTYTMPMPSDGVTREIERGRFYYLGRPGPPS